MNDHISANIRNWATLLVRDALFWSIVRGWYEEFVRIRPSQGVVVGTYHMYGSSLERGERNWLGGVGWSMEEVRSWNGSQTGSLWQWCCAVSVVVRLWEKVRELVEDEAGGSFPRKILIERYLKRHGVLSISLEIKLSPTSENTYSYAGECWQPSVWKDDEQTSDV